eukprot:tig00001003_g6293.t1
MTLQSLFILSSSGEAIVEKHWRGVLSRSVCTEFWDNVTKAETHEEVLPIIAATKYYLIHVYKNGLFFLAVVQAELSPLFAIEFLNRVVEIFADYFGEVSEDAIKENFITVYQLLDEMLDNGMPLTTEPGILKSMILPPSLANRVLATVGNQSQVRSSLPEGTLGNIPWRRHGIRYASNEIYFDLIEEVDCILDSNGNTISADVSGEIICNSRLSGMPDLTLNFSDPALLDDCAFHPCVRLARFEQEKLLSFVPPDGQFRLMTYKTKMQSQLPIYCKPQFNAAGGFLRINIMVGVKAVGPHSKGAEDVRITIPFPKGMFGAANLSATAGQVRMDEVNKVCVWEIGRVPPQRAGLVLQGHLPLIQQSGSASHGSTALADTSIAILLDFKISMWTVSGQRIENLNIANERYKPYKGVRTMTRAGRFQIRT